MEKGFTLLNRIQYKPTFWQVLPLLEQLWSNGKSRNFTLKYSFLIDYLEMSYQWFTKAAIVHICKCISFMQTYANSPLIHYLSYCYFNQINKYIYMFDTECWYLVKLELKRVFLIKNADEMFLYSYMTIYMLQHLLKYKD